MSLLISILNTYILWTQKYMYFKLVVIFGPLAMYNNECVCQNDTYSFYKK